MEWQMTERADSPWPIFWRTASTTPLKRSRSSPLLMASTLAPISSTPYLSSVPASCSEMAVLRAVWPPRVGSRVSGRSLAMIFSTYSGVIGSTYVASAISGSVMIVAGLEFTRMTLRPSARRMRHAWVPE